VIPYGAVAERRRLYLRLKETGQPIIIFQGRRGRGFLPDGSPCVRTIVEPASYRNARDRARGAPSGLLTASQHWPARRERTGRHPRHRESLPCRVLWEMFVCGSEGMGDTHLAMVDMSIGRGLPDVFLGGNDKMAIAALAWAPTASAIRRMKVTVSTAFDLARTCARGLTTIRSPPMKWGRRARAAPEKTPVEGALTQSHLLSTLRCSPAIPTSGSGSGGTGGRRALARRAGGGGGAPRTDAYSKNATRELGQGEATVALARARHREGAAKPRKDRDSLPVKRLRYQLAGADRRLPTVGNQVDPSRRCRFILGRGYFEETSLAKIHESAQAPFQLTGNSG